MLASILLLAASLTPFSVSITPSPTWKSQVVFPKDAFEGPNLSPGLPRWIKFTVFVDDIGPVYFQDGQTYAFHYDFATNQLDPFLGFSHSELDAVSLQNDGRVALLGAVLLPPDKDADGFPIPTPAEFGIQLVSLDPLDSQLVIDVFNSVATAVVPAFGSAKPYYFPTFEQSSTAIADAALLGAAGIEVSGTERWQTGDAIYSRGWAVGRLNNVPSDQIEAAFESGQLLPTDILLTDGIPAELPPLAGILSTAPSTPNSHVAILAQSFNIPFVHISEPEQQAQALALVGRQSFIRAYPKNDLNGNPAGIFMFDLEHELDAATISMLADLHAPPSLVLPPLTTLGSLTTHVDGLALADVVHVGGKAAHYAMLRDVLGDTAPIAAAISLDLWVEFLDQVMPGGLTLRQEINAALAGQSWPPTDMGALLDTLDDLRDRIEDDTEFTPAQEAAVLALLADSALGFDPNAKIRFRSSTNVEDTAQFSGAGLYESKSGCLSDDLDQDSDGPSACDPLEPKEKGVFRAIRKVYASFYNDNAFLERLRHGVDEAQVGMAVLVHHSYPDEFELANGVATLTRNASGQRAILATQPGAASVTNPDGDAVPELVEVRLFSFGPQVSLLQGSSLLPLGESTLEFTADYVTLAGMFEAVADEYALRTGKNHFVLDFEFKKLTPGGAAAPLGGLIIKQVREIPQADTTPSVTPYLINVPVELCTYQGEVSGDLFNNQRLKSRLWISTRNTWLTEAELAQATLFTDFTLEFTDGCNLHQTSGSLHNLPGFAHDYDAGFGTTFDSWDFDAGQNLPRRLTLENTAIPSLVAPARCPILTQLDLSPQGALLRAEYEQPVMSGYVEGMPPTLSSTGYAVMRPCFVGTPSPFPAAPDPLLAPMPQVQVGAKSAPLPNVSVQAGGFVVEGFMDGAGVEVLPTYATQSPGGPFSAGFTLDLHHFVETSITGLTPETIWLRSEYSQTFKPGHHNFSDFFLFCPELDPDVPQHQKDALAAADIYAIYIEGRAFSIGGDKTDVFDYLSRSEFVQLCAAGVPYGCGTNPSGSLSLPLGPPRLGDQLQLALDNPLGTQAAPAIGVLSLAIGAAPSYPCGNPIADWGMQAPMSAGEYLLNPATIIRTKFGSPWQGAGSPSIVNLVVPNDPSLLGLQLYAQGLLVAPGQAIEYGLTEGIEMTLAY